MPIPRVSFQFTDEQWEAIGSVRKSWPNDIDWVLARDTMEQLARTWLMMRASRLRLGSPVEVRNRLRTGSPITEIPSCDESAATLFAKSARIHEGG